MCFRILNPENKSLWKSELYNISSLETKEVLSFFRKEIEDACKEHNVVPILEGRFNKWFSVSEEKPYLVQEKTEDGWIDIGRLSSINSMRHYQIGLRNAGRFGTFRLLHLLGVVNVEELRDSGADGVEPGIQVLFHGAESPTYLFVGDVVETTNNEILTIKSYDNETGLFGFMEQHAPMSGDEFINRQ